ncbi:MAG TPA: ATP-grasp domain-containing protein [Gaiellaceae bacterium]|nr:ATP-grasp domain-containing protein [Gaiellaceae bacterium]
MARLLFLGASVSQLPAIRYAKSVGHEVVACDGDPRAVAFDFCDVREPIDFSDVDRVTAVGRRERVEGVLAICTDRAVVPAALVAERLCLPGIEAEVAHAMTHKPTMRRLLTKAGVPQPAYEVVDTVANVAQFASVPMPAVLKPADSGGQRGLFMIERTADLASHLPDTLAASRGGEALIEEFIDGAELNTLFAVRGGVPALLSVSDRLRPPGLGFGVGWIHRFPSELPATVVAEVIEVAEAAIRGLGLRDGIAFPQLIASSRGVYVVEVAARIAAGQMADLVRYGTGIEMFEIAIAQALGQPVRDSLVEPRLRRPIAIRFLTASPGLLPVGTVTAIRGLDEVRAARGVLDAGLYFGVGTRIGPLQVDADRRGYVIATGTTTSEALEHADAAARKLLIETETPRSNRSGEARLPAVILCAALLAATVVAFALTERAKLQQALVTGTRIDKTFSPICRCPQRVAHITFRLMHRARVSVGLVDKAGTVIATLVHSRAFAAGPIHLEWNGRGAQGHVVPPSRYVPQVSFLGQRRTLRLPSPITVDTDRPKVARATLRIGRTAVIRYRFSELAYAALFVNGARIVFTRFAPTKGSIRTASRLIHGDRVSLVAIDLAGNRSDPFMLRLHEDVHRAQRP